MKIGIKRVSENFKFFSDIAKIRSVTYKKEINVFNILSNVISTLSISYWGDYNIPIYIYHNYKYISINEIYKQELFIKAIPNEIELILDNLLKNSIKACIEKKSIINNSKNNYNYSPLIKIDINSHKFETIIDEPSLIFEIKIEDNGTGISEDKIREIFLNGSGIFKEGEKIGLFQVQKYIEKNDLAIQVYSKNILENERKTVFSVIGKFIEKLDFTNILVEI